ncbi:hypothetical protein GYMLUDRAFT_966399 [Collybiopsis luxurians FD-317 M1]|uniref:Uncharacterized protein n=1 Tax=Collybiopsis luxurians FD-317 M1 TaxID=944289 RepID=A0A0D0C3V3_9AGAR|nr:hypothetical protein GYMLUDRAFT_966399 [Collybiopsis luxurians FD-317 M1]
MPLKHNRELNREDSYQHFRSKGWGFENCTAIRTAFLCLGGPLFQCQGRILPIFFLSTCRVSALRLCPAQIKIRSWLILYLKVGPLNYLLVSVGMTFIASHCRSNPIWHHHHVISNRSQ